MDFLMGVLVTRYSRGARKFPRLPQASRLVALCAGKPNLRQSPLWGIDQVESSAVSEIEKGHPDGCPFSMVEVTRFELATSTSRT